MATVKSETADALLEAMTERFVGYGSPAAPLWFVGLEEGGAGTWRDVVRHLGNWAEQGRPQFASLRPSSVPADHRWFGRQPRLQPYWQRLSRLALAAEGRPSDRESTRDYQKRELAGADSGSALLELMPLPAPSTAHWIYGEHSSIPWLADRETYRHTIIDQRIALFRELIQRYRPPAVVFVGAAAQETWSTICGRELPTPPAVPVSISSATKAIMIKHPASYGARNDYYESVGASLRPSSEGM